MIFEQDPEKYDQFMSPRILLESADTMPVRVVNPYPHPITIYEHQKLGTVTSARRVERVADWNDHLVSEEPRMEGLKLSDSSLTY